MNEINQHLTDELTN